MIASVLPALLGAEAHITTPWEEGLPTMLTHTFAETAPGDSERQLKIESRKQAIRDMPDHCTFAIVQERKIDASSETT